ncbi:MAG: 50S ribosomal protein L18 [Chlamydiales bacterium]|nr:50S ribosomal protein L18 [Chlamydiales bacterium]MCH9635783.1 50S ribosomal protein L18 [Chlamydiales bacterium]MCH9703954.1 50S ribosomal protein L18 [Chlamydiota bacterium]
MENSKKHSTLVRRKRTFRVRKKLRGTSERPRISVIKTNKHVHVQLIDDEKQLTLAHASTLSSNSKKSCANSKELGSSIAKACEKLKIKKAVLDRGRFKYHGVVAAVADGAREGGVEV